MKQLITPMGQEIAEEENAQEQDEQAQQKPKKQSLNPQDIQKNLINAAKKFKKPKLITIVILFATLILVSVGLNLLGKRNADESLNTTTPQTSSPAPDVSPDLNAQNVTVRIKNYTSKLNKLDNYQKNLSKPIVDLEISFK